MNIITLTKPNGDVVNLPPAAISEFLRLLDLGTPRASTPS
jgi:hypothetical protein